MLSYLTTLKFAEYREWLSVLVLLAGTLFIWWLVVRTAGRARRHFESMMAQAMQSPDAQSQLAVAQRRLTALRLVTNAARYAVAVTIALILLQRLGIRLDSLVLPAGFLAAAVGFGSQNLVRDIVSGLFVVFEGLFAVGDVVNINGVLGEVEEVGLRVTSLRDDNGQLHYFPNGAIATIAKYPHRYVPMLLIVPLTDPTQRSAADTIVRGAIHEFQERYNALVAFTGGADSENGGELVRESEDFAGEKEAAVSVLKLRLLARPQRVSRVSEKLPTIITAALEGGEIKVQAGAVVEAIMV